MKTPKTELLKKIISLVSYYEGGGLSDNSDGQIISFGTLQWNLGQGTLLPVLRYAYSIDKKMFTNILGQQFVDALLNGDLKLFAQENILPNFNYWFGRFEILRNSNCWLQAEVQYTKPYINNGQKLCELLGFETERGLALCIDVAVQNGAPRQDHILEYKRKLGTGRAYPSEWQKLKLFASVVASFARPQYYFVVLSRKQTIALGRGIVYGRNINLEIDYGISYWRKWWI